MNYFPESPIPHWPTRMGRGCKTVEEAIFEFGLNLSAASAKIRSDMYHDGKPLICIQCGASTTSDGDLSCGH